MEIDNVQDFGNLGSTPSSATAGTVPAATTTTTASTAATTTATSSTSPATENAPPKTSTIKIQSPPPKSERKDDQITLTLRQASEEAASKAKENTRAKAGLSSTSESKVDTEGQSKSPTATTSTESEEKHTEEKESEEKHTEEKGSEKKDTEEKGSEKKDTEEKESEKKDTEEKGSEKKDSEGDGSSPHGQGAAHTPEAAAESSANIRAANVEALDPVGHQHGSTVSATSPVEQAKGASDVKKSVSGDPGDTAKELEEEHGIKDTQSETKRELVSANEGVEVEKPKAEPADSLPPESSAEKATREQDPEHTSKANTSVDD